jgi:hypothetical protein
MPIADPSKIFALESTGKFPCFRASMVSATIEVDLLNQLKCARSCPRFHPLCNTVNVTRQQATAVPGLVNVLSGVPPHRSNPERTDSPTHIRPDLSVARDPLYLAAGAAALDQDRGVGARVDRTAVSPLEQALIGLGILPGVSTSGGRPL